MESSGLTIVDDGSHEQRELLFDVVEDLGGAPEVLEPAYVDAQSSRVIRKGRIRLGSVVAVPAGPPAESPGSAREEVKSDGSELEQQHEEDES